MLGLTSKHYINGINSSNIRITCSFRRRCILWFVMHRREYRFKCLQSTIHISECRIYVTNWRLNEKCDHLVTVHHTKWRRKISFFSIWGKLSLKYWIFPISLTFRIFHVYTTSHLLRRIDQISLYWAHKAQFRREKMLTFMHNLNDELFCNKEMNSIWIRYKFIRK